MIIRENEKITLSGPRRIRIFRKGTSPVELTSEDDLSFLLK
jgi:hypothetical protein